MPPAGRNIEVSTLLSSTTSPLVGRDKELAQLHEVMERAERFHAPQLVTVVGNPGVGKSRLVAEFLARVLEPGDAERVTPRVLRAQAQPGSGSYGLVQRLLKDRFAVDDSEDRETTTAKVRAQLEAVFGDKRVGEVMHFLGRFVDLSIRESPLARALEDDPRQHESVARTVLRRVFELDAANTPLVLAIEDLHHADDRSLELLAELAAGLAGSPLVLVATARPDLLVRYGRWGAEADHTRIDLLPLVKEPAEQLMRHLLSRLDPIPQILLDEAAAMTNGNPFFIEELVRMFIAEGVVKPRAGGEGRWQVDVARARRAQLPLTVEQAIQARIGLLSLDERDLLEKAATFGNVFWAGSLVCLRRLDKGDSPGRALDDPERASVERALAGLVDRDYLLRMPDSSVSGEVEFVFKHNLERELVTRMTPPDRVRRHALFGAQWVETRLSARTEEQLEFLAGLYEKGGDGTRAANAWFAAGDSARSRHATQAARDFYARGLKLLDGIDALGRIDALHSLGVVTALVGATRESLGHFEEMLRAAWLLDLPAKAGAANSRIARCYRTLGELDRAEHFFERAQALFTRAGDQRGLAGVEDDLGSVAYLRGEYQKAEERHQKALELREQIGDPRSTALTLHNLALVAQAAGNHAAAIAHAEEALALRREIGDRVGTAQSLMEMGLIWQSRGESARAVTAYEEGLVLVREAGDRVVEASLLVRMGESLVAAWRPTDAAEVLSQAVTLSAELGDRLAQAEALRLLGEASLEQGKADVARDHCKHALELLEKVGSPAHRGLAHRAYGVVLGQSAVDIDRSTADAHFGRAIELLGDVGADAELVKTYRAYGDYLARIGDQDGARTVRDRAEEIARKLDEGAAPTVAMDLVQP